MASAIIVPGTNWSIDANPFPAATSTATPVVLNVTNRGHGTLTPAGIVAVIGQISTYYAASSNAAPIAMMRGAGRGRAPLVLIETGAFSYTVLASNFSAQVAALTTILQTAANWTP